MLDYALLEAVAAVDREGSFEAAARALHISTSAVSQRVRLLEERVGVPLVVRSRPCVATEAGRRLCRHVERVGLLEQELRGTLPAGTGSAAVLRVAVNADSLGTWFPGAMARFAATDDTLLDVVLDNENHTAEWLRTGQVPAAVAADARAVPGCRLEALGPMRYVATASPELARRHFRDGVDATSLAHAPMLRFDRKDDLEKRWMRRICRRDLLPPTHWVPATQAFLDLALAGFAWGMNPEQLAAPYLKSGALVELVPGTALEVPLYWHHARLAPPAIERLTRAVVAEARVRLQRGDASRARTRPRAR